MARISTTQVADFIKERFAVLPEYLWEKYPSYAVFRHPKTKKWFAVVMEVSAKSLKLDGDEQHRVINLRTENAPTLNLGDGFYPAYHMNKERWITAELNGILDKEFIFALIEESYYLIENQKKTTKKNR